MKLTIFIIHQFFTILEKAYLATYWALKTGLPLILFTMDIEKKMYAFSYQFLIVFTKYIDALHLLRFYIVHPLLK